MSSPGAAGRDGRASRSDCPPIRRRYPRSSRLTSRRQFLAVQARGRRVRSASFTIIGMRNDAAGSRIGITVTRKVGGAVVRNRVKRVIREVFRSHRLALEPAVDLVVIAHPGIAARASVELETEFLRRFRELVRRLER